MKTGVLINAEHPQDANDAAAFLFREEPFVRSMHADRRIFRVRFADEPWEPPCRLDDMLVRVSTANSDALSHYCRAPRGLYLALLATLGLVQACALRRNPLLRPEDLMHQQPGCCLFSACDSFDALARALDEPRICAGSVAFYEALLVAPEVNRLQSFAEAMGSSALR